MTELTIIAEAGVNHNGDIGRAKEMVHAAKDAGADVVKFQSFTPEGLSSRYSDTAAYQRTNTGVESQLDLLQGLEVSLDNLAVLAQECSSAGIEFLCTPFAHETVGPLLEMGMKRIKVASGEMTCDPFLEHFGSFGVPVLLSTGMANETEVGHALGILDATGAGEVTILHCTSLYPAPPDVTNLSAIATLSAAFNRPVGYSDHTLSDHIAIASVALGATVLEKHFTLSRSLPGPDHVCSIEPDELALLVTRCRETASALGNGIKEPHPSELDTLKIARRSWHATRNLEAGTAIAEGDVVLKRPATGLPPSVSPFGRKLKNARTEDEVLQVDDLA